MAAGDKLKYDEWLADFTKDKKEVPPVDVSDKFALHSMRRYIDKENHLWETALTYTGRLMIRSGSIQPDGVIIKWTEWDTRHDVELSKGR